MLYRLKPIFLVDMYSKPLIKKVKVKQSHYRPVGAQRVPGS